MASYYNPNEFRASSSAFAWGSQVHTKYKTGCYRRILLQSRNVNKDIAAKYSTMGLKNEDRYAATILADTPYIREAEFKEIIPGTDVMFSGHSDFVTEHTVHELKHVQSKNVRRDVIRAGHWVPENLAQLVSYMGHFGKDYGKLVFSFYDDEKADNPSEERTFTVMLDKYGRIHIDSQPTQYTFYDIIAHRSQAALAIQHGLVLDRPLGWDTPFVSPCSMCPFKAACDKFDLGEIIGTEAYVTACKSLVEGNAA